MIYNEVFRVNGVLIYNHSLTRKASADRQGFGIRLCRPQTASEKTSDGTVAWSFLGHDVYTGPPETMLSLLLTNLQIFQEAMPVFYNINTFKVPDFLELMRLLHYCGPTRRLHFTHIQVRDCDAVSRATSKKAFDLIAQIKQLQSLEIQIGDYCNFKNSSVEPQKLYWVKWLCKLSVPSLHIEGNGGRIGAYIREQRSGKEGEVDQAKPKKPSPKRASSKKLSSSKPPTKKPSSNKPSTNKSSTNEPTSKKMSPHRKPSKPSRRCVPKVQRAAKAT